MCTTGNQELIRITNQKLIMKLIKEKKSISRADIAKALNLSAPSISSNINKLLESRVIYESGEGESKGGRRPILIELNKNYGYIAGIYIRENQIKIFVENLCAEIINSKTININNNSLESEIKNIVFTMNAFLKENNLPKNNIKIIVVSEDIYMKNSIYIDEALKNEYGAEILYMRNSDSAGYGEYEYGSIKKFNNVIYIDADENISASLIIDGKLYGGRDNSAGLIGNTVFSKEHISSIYKNRGYLNNYVSISNLIQRISNSYKSDRMLLEMCDYNLNNIDFNIIKRAYESGNLYIKNELDSVIDKISITASNISLLLNPDAIIFGGRYSLLGEYYFISIKKVISSICTSMPYITFPSLNDNSSLYGMYAFGLKALLAI